MTRHTKLYAIIAACAISLASAAQAAPARLSVTTSGVRWHGAALSGQLRTLAAPVARWWLAARDTGLAGTAVLCALADSLAARGDTIRADSLLAEPRLARSLWAWEALRRRAAWALAHPHRARASRLLEAADRKAWPDAEDAAWHAMLAPVRLAMRDTLGAEALARNVLERYVSQVPASAQALALLDTLARRRREPFPLRLARRAAQVEWASGQRQSALLRMSRIARTAPAEERGADQLQRVQWLREWRRPSSALAASDTALRWTAGTPAFDRVRLERARAFRDAGRVDSSLALYARVGRSAEESHVRVTAWWECAREAQDASRWAVAANAFRVADSLGRKFPESGSLVRSAAAQGGMMDWLRGRQDAAIQSWRSSSDRRARFWLGVALHQRGGTEGDSILRAEFASRPGYDLYAVAARDTLGSPSWPRAVLAPAVDTLEPGLVAAVVALSGSLALPDAAARIVAARDRRDPRVTYGTTRGIAASSWRAIAVSAYTSGDLAAGTRAADRALLAGGADSIAWGWAPWGFPPAYASELAAAADTAGVERALLWALVRQESRFDARAISRSNARGLTQLLPGTARDMARALRESMIADTLLFEPARNLRYGARYLRKLLDRFDGSIPVALAAYNAGPGKVRDDWREILARGGWALYCELASNADTQDYVRRILGYRQAYSELRPLAGAGP